MGVVAMSDNTEQYNDLFEDDSTEDTQPQGEQPEGPKALREAYKREKTQREQAEKELQELRNVQRKSELEGKLETAGFPKGAAKFALDAEDIDAWMNENRELFGVAGNEPVGQTAVPEDQLAQMQAVQNVQPGSAPLGTDMLQSQVNSADTSANSREEFYAELEKLGALGSAR